MASTSTLANLLTSEKYNKLNTSLSRDSSRTSSQKRSPISFDGDERLPLCPSIDNHEVKPRGWLLQIVVVFVYTIFVSITSFAAGAFIFRTTNASCTQQLSTYSPMSSAVEYQEINVSDVYSGNSNLYRGAPTAEGDAAWNKLWDHPSFNIPEDKFFALNYAKDVSWRHTSPEFGGGIEVQAEVYHNLHCLNLLRQFVWLDHYDVPPHGFNETSENIHIHADHCIEALRLTIMCAGDVTVVPIKYTIETSMERGYMSIGGELEFDTRRVCRNFEKLLEWTEENGVPSSVHGHDHGHK